jgi:hypothetical protein
MTDESIGAVRADIIHLPFSAQCILYRCNNTRFKPDSAPSREPKFGDSAALTHAEMPRRTAI